jgi:integrase
MPRKNHIVLTDRFVRSARPPLPVQGRDVRIAHRDALVPGLAMRITSRGHRSWTLSARFPSHPKNWTRRCLGDVYVGHERPTDEVSHGALTVSEARNKARRWIDMLARGIDPAVEAEDRRAVARRREASTFAMLWQAFVDHQSQRIGRANELRRAGEAFDRLWGRRQIGEIEPREIAAYFRTIADHPAEARNRFGHLSRCFTWLIGTGAGGITGNPCSVLRPSDLLGAKAARDRVLTDAELRLLWAATAGPMWEGEGRQRGDGAQPMGFPWGSLVRLLLLTGVRLGEGNRALWSEIDLQQQLWEIPAARMKNDRVHAVPFGQTTHDLLAALPRLGDHVFTISGTGPVGGHTRAKRRLDAAMAHGAAAAGMEPIPNWTFHDLRRTMRTHLSALPIEDRVREQMVAHAQPGLHRVYDRHSYQDEKRRGFALWEARLMSIVEPAQADVVSLEGARQRRRTASS